MPGITTMVLASLANITFSSIAYYTLTLAIAVAIFFIAFLILFLHTPGDFQHPYYEEGSGFGNDFAVVRGYSGRRMLMPPPRRVRRGRAGYYIPPLPRMRSPVF
ncbi:hypothetical protein TWF481_011701 [Arthrobotrys musiformis]|uniref:Uncharacterized protein n=1 Tax=Arthrobotrys musiformis TaxID=47236 RepID=A0AAV9W1J4_9PEZI